MKILLVDVDSKMPNLALMKLSAYHKAQGDEVRLWRMQTEDCTSLPCVEYDRTYVSCIFGKNAWVARAFDGVPGAEIGGYGVNGAKLPDEIEHTMPDYDLYGCDFLMGYTTRGCIRNCPWCKVPEMEGCIRDHAPISEFHHPDYDKLVLLDNNLFALDWKFREDIKYIVENGLKVNFSQGLDIRLIDEEKVGLLADCKYYDWHFKNRRLHFAFDMPEIEEEVVKGIEILKGAGIPPRHLMFYMLVGFGVNNGYSWGDFIRNDYHRFEVLDRMGVLPYVMTYNDRCDIPLLNPHFERWVNGRYYKVCDFEGYDKGNSQEVIFRAKSLEGETSRR